MNWNKLQTKHYFAEPVEYIHAFDIFDQKEYDKLINAAEEIAEAKIKFFDTFGVKASYKYGGMVEINHLTRPLGNF